MVPAAPQASSETADGVTITTVPVSASTSGITTVRFGRDGSSVAFEWTDPELRFLFRQAGAESWIDVGGDETHTESGMIEAPHGEDGAMSPPGLDPVWVGAGTDSVEVQILGGDPTGLEALLFSIEDGGQSDVTKTDARAYAAATASLAGSRTINSPASWGSAGWSYANCPNGPKYMDRVDFAVIHHTATGNTYSSSQVDDQLRSIHAFHVRTRGWCDIAYNFVVDRFGQVWQARSGDLFAAVQGGHTAGFNTGAVGISLLGDFGGSVPSNAMLTAAGDIAGWKLASFGNTSSGTSREVSGGSAKWPEGQEVDVDRLTYHRNLQSTSCPGAQVWSRRSVIASAAARAKPSQFTYGRYGDIPLIGDWDGDGVETPTIRRNNVYHLRNTLTSGVADRSYSFGWNSDIPISGDWDGDGVDTLGVFRDGRFYLRNSNTSGVAHIDFALGRSGDVPIAGDWDGDGRTEVGVRRGAEILLWDSDRSSGRNASAPQLRFAYGRTGDVPVTGDWDHDGVTTVSVRRGSSVYINNRHFGGAASFEYSVRVGQYALVGHSALGLPMPIVSDGRNWQVGTPVVPG